MLSSMPPVLPILKQPGLMPPTVAGPMTVTCFSAAMAFSFRVRFSGIPSAMMAMVRIYKKQQEIKQTCSVHTKIRMKHYLRHGTAYSTVLALPL